MAHNSIIKDPDNKFWVGINWASWVNDQQKETGGFCMAGRNRVSH